MNKFIYIVNKNSQLFKIEKSLLEKLHFSESLLKNGCVFFNNEKDATELASKHPMSMLDAEELIDVSFIVLDHNSEEYLTLLPNNTHVKNRTYVYTNERPIAFDKTDDLLNFIIEHDPFIDFDSDTFKAIVL